jgi:beta-phosphoglucomutase-like phosphatase (HAD superfamily)
MCPEMSQPNARVNDSKLVMLDYDGVIVDSLEPFCRIVAAGLVRHGWSSPDVWCKSIVGMVSASGRR